MNSRCGYPRKNTMSTERVSWRRDANELRILARIEASQISNRLNVICPIHLPNSCLSAYTLGGTILKQRNFILLISPL